MILSSVHLRHRYLILIYFLFIIIIVQVDNSPCVLEILDTAGTEQFASMRDLYIKNGHGFIVMYSLTNHQTFQDITTMRNVISRVKGSQPAPILLVANKLDLECQREVSTEEGEKACSCSLTLRFKFQKKKTNQ
jgi:small GTP-binding protein